MATLSPSPTSLPSPYRGEGGFSDGDDIGNKGDSSTSSMNISTGVLVAIIVVVVVVAIIGACTAALFFVAKKREWTAKAVLRHSVKKVVNAMTPRRTEFPPDAVKRSTGPSKKFHRHLGETTQIRPDDIEKALSQDQRVKRAPKDC